MTLTPDQARSAVDRVRPVVVLTTLEPPPETLDALIDAGRRQGATIVLNATPEAIGAKPLLDRIDVLIVNETEAEDLLGHAVSATSGEEAARSLSELGPTTVVVTLGAAGAAVAHGGQTASFPAPSVEVVDTTGAGDAFAGVLATYLAKGRSLTDAFTLANAAAALATTAFGAQAPVITEDQLHSLVARS
jgi:ribokinase